MDAIGLVGLTFRTPGRGRGRALHRRPRSARSARSRTSPPSWASPSSSTSRPAIASRSLYRETDGRRAGDRRRDVFRVLTGQEPQPGEAERTLRGWHRRGRRRASLRRRRRARLGAGRRARDPGAAARRARDGTRAGAAGTAGGAARPPGRGGAARRPPGPPQTRRSARAALSLAEIAADYLLERVRRSPGRWRSSASRR